MIQSWRDIPGFFDFSDLYDLAVQNVNGAGKLVEVGAFLGKSAAYLSEAVKRSGKNCVVFAVDPHAWDDKPEWWKFRGDDLDPNPVPWPVPQIEGMRIADACDYCLRMAEAQDVRMVRRFSVDAAKLFGDGTLDLVFIDANHNYDPVKADIAAWLPKVRLGGIIAGHDYTAWNWPGVKQAVDEAFGDRVQVMGNSWLVHL